VILTDLLIGHPGCFAGGHILDPHPVERGEQQLTAVGRSDRVSDLPGRYQGGRIDLIGKTDLGAYGEIDISLERYLTGRGTVHRDAPHLAAVGNDDSA